MIALRIADIVRTEPAMAYVVALKETLTADGLLIPQASKCNAQVPAKLYKHLRVGRPILALNDPSEDSARAIEQAKAGMIARFDPAEEIERVMLRLPGQLNCAPGRRGDHVMRSAQQC